MASTVKRSLSSSPPPPAPGPISSTSSAVAESSKRVKLDHNETSTALDASNAASGLSLGPSEATTPVAPAGKKENKKKAAGGKKKGMRKAKPPKPGGAEETGYYDVVELLGLEKVTEMQEEDEVNWQKLASEEWGIGRDGKECVVRVLALNAHGDGLAVLPSSSSSSSSSDPSTSTSANRLVTVPFTLPTELVKIHVHRHEPDPYYMSHADLVEIVEPSVERGKEVSLDEGEVSKQLQDVRKKFGNRVMCKYFGTCSGCQYQPLSYAAQLLLKQNVIKNAFRNFSGLSASQIPEIGETLPSVKQYGYRTKLTPHFQTPPNSNPKGKKGKETAEVPRKEWEVTIGFEEKGRKRIVDIEECVIATSVINETLKTERERVKANITSYKRGATLLLRDSLPPRSASSSTPVDTASSNLTISPLTTTTDESHICITDHHAVVREKVGNVEFEQQAGSFFQNNNSILPSLIDYIATAIQSSQSWTSLSEDKKKTYLVDAYCGSGLFGISLANQFDTIEGVEIDKASIKWAIKNADFNKGPGRGDVGFREGSAERIFGDINFPPDQTTILIDPPRKGCDNLFLTQLLNLYPSTVIYVSCNVHTQARDIGWLITESEKKMGGSGKGYRIESLRAADLFPMTHHAEGVAILRRDVVV